MPTAVVEALPMQARPSVRGGELAAPGLDRGLIRALEEASLTGLPALRTEAYDGWLIRQSDGYSRRANSVWALYPSRLELEEKITYCERAYARVGLPCVFKMTGAGQPAELDRALAARGYRHEAETLVTTLELPDRIPATDRVAFLPEPNGEWIEGWRALSDRAPQSGVLRALLAAVPGEAAYAVIRQDGDAVACARAAVSGGWVGLFDLAVAPAARRMGLARELIWARLSWGARVGARRAFLQVMEENGPARRLQEAIGFGEAYRYWYRIQEV